MEQPGDLRAIMGNQRKISRPPEAPESWGPRRPEHNRLILVRRAAAASRVRSPARVPRPVHHMYLSTSLLFFMYR